MIHVDTHVLVWLYGGEVEALPPAARSLLEREDIVISPMAILELDLLHEIRRISITGGSIVEDLVHRVGLRVAETPFVRVVECASSLGWTRDPFDRLIVAGAVADSAQLLTKDATILANFDGAVWEPKAPKRRRR